MPCLLFVCHQALELNLSFTLHPLPHLATQTLTLCKTEMTVLCGPGARQRTVREVEREPLVLHRPLPTAAGAAAAGAAGGTPSGAGPSARQPQNQPLPIIPRQWYWYLGDDVIDRRVWDPKRKRMEVVQTFLHPDATGVCMRKAIFGEGAERMVHLFQEVRCLYYRITACR